MRLPSRASIDRLPPRKGEIQGPLKWLISLLFFAFSFGCITGVFYLVDQAHQWTEHEIVTAKPPAPPKFTEFELGRRNFFQALIDEGITREDANSIVASLKEVDFPFSRLRPNQKIVFKFNHLNLPLEMSFQMDKTESFVASRMRDHRFVAHKDVEATIRRPVTIAGAVERTVYNAIIDAGESGTLTAKFIEIFGWDIDFSSDTRKGDTFVLLLEKEYIERTGEFIGYGRLLAGRYDSKKLGVLEGFYFDHPVEKERGFYSRNGKQMRKFMLRAPLNTLRVTSRFGFRRHPVLGKYKAHNGIDYGAPTGTPIWAVADGKVIKAGRFGAAGNMVAIDHGNGLQSYYMHLSRINVKSGQQVRQRHMIGRVGSTGRSTGPHLHFGLKQNGAWTDPTKRSFGKEKFLEKEYLPKLEAVVQEMASKLEAAAAAVAPIDQDDDQAEPEADAPLS